MTLTDADRAAIDKICREHGWHPDISQYVAEGIRRERERCAKICEKIIAVPSCRHVGIKCAAAIRAGSET